MAGPDSPGQSTALVRKRTDTELMPPPPAPKRIQRPKTVLDEDTYADGLSKIIARDFFPGLLESEAQSDYLDALASHDPAWIASAGRRLRAVMATPEEQKRQKEKKRQRERQEGRQRAWSATPSVVPRPGETPRSFAGDTPGSARSFGTSDGDDKDSRTNQVKVDTNVGLAAFQARYTSEDNESFYRLLDRQNQARAEKHAWLWNGNQLPSKMQVRQKEVEDRLLLARGSLNDDGHRKGRLAIRDRDSRPAAPELWKFTAKNTLMFAPEGVDGDRGSGNSGASFSDEKAIVYANTRLPGTTLPESSSSFSLPSSADTRTRAPSPTLSAVRDALAGRPRPADRDSTAGSTATGGETPRVNGYAYVADEDDDDDDDDPTKATSVLSFGSVDAAPNPFQLQAQSRREGLHHRMVERIAQSKRTAARVGLTGRIAETPLTSRSSHPPSPSVRGNLTPAGQRLLSRLGGGSGDGGKKTDVVSAFNRKKPGGNSGNKGSRRARLRQQRLYG